jgi:hypothetical protein
MRESENYAPPPRAPQSPLPKCVMSRLYVLMYECRRAACKQVFGGLVTRSREFSLCVEQSAARAAGVCTARTELFISHWLTIKQRDRRMVHIFVCLYTTCLRELTARSKCTRSTFLTGRLIQATWCALVSRRLAKNCLLKKSRC